jgi:energy-coupling factor transporter ATP-binding protein EcfA2
MNTLRVERLEYYNLEPVSLHVGEEIAGLAGASGSGKTLFLRALADLDPHGGKVFLNGDEQADFPPSEWRKKVGFLPTESTWWFDRVGQHFEQVNEEWFNKLGFDKDVLDWQTGRLSSGEKQRLALLRVLGIEPSALLLDEPTANIDSGNTKNVIDLVSAYHKEHHIPVIWVSHTIEQLRDIASRIFVIQDQKILPEKT